MSTFEARGKTLASLGGILLLAALLLDSRQAIGQGSYADFKSLAARGIRDGSAEVRPPKIGIQDGTLVAYLGLARISYGAMESPAGVSLLEAQMQTELIRRFRNTAQQQRNWQPYLQRADRIVRAALLNLQHGRLDQQGAWDAVDQVRRTLEHACREIARQNGLECEIRGLAFAFAVDVRTEPAGASVWLMHALEPALARVEGRPPSWEKLVQTEAVPLAGKYWYFLKWNDGSTSGPELMTIASGADVVLR